MDFNALLMIAKKNTEDAAKDNRKCYNTKYSPPKKEKKDNKLLSENIRKFLKQREEEEQQHRREWQQRVANSNAISDQKSTKTKSKMFKGRKIFNNVGSKAVGQHDTKDYMYVSTPSNESFKSTIDKLKSANEIKRIAPSQVKSSYNRGTRERIKDDIYRVGTSATFSSKKEHNDRSSHHCKAECKRTTSALKENSKFKRPGQVPPMDFHALLRLAEQKQHEHVNTIEKEKEPERLLTAREKREQEDYIRRREARNRSKEKISSGQPMELYGRFPKVSCAATAMNKKPSSIMNESEAKSLNYGNNPQAKKVASPKSHKLEPPFKKTTKINTTAKPRTALLSGNPYAGSKSNWQKRKFPRCEVSSKFTKTMAFPAPSAEKKPPAKVGIRVRSVGLDDFIDDTQCEEDISLHIRSIFGYDKNKYRDFDDDDKGMESSYQQIQLEEFISKKIGFQEDVEDLRMEAEHKKAKMAKKRSRVISDHKE